MAQYPTWTIKRIRITVVLTREKNLNVGCFIRRRLLERDVHHWGPLAEGPCNRAFESVIKSWLRGESVGELCGSSLPPRHVFEEGIVRDHAKRCGFVCVDYYVGDATPGCHDLFKSVDVELAGDVEVVILLVGFDGRYEGVIEVVVEVWCIGDVAEMVEVVFDIG